MNDLTHCNPAYFFFPFFFHEDYHESSGCSTVHTDSRSMHVCEYATPLFCMLNYYFNHFLGNKFLKKTQSNIETDRLYKLLDDKKSRESWPVVDTNYISLHYHFDRESCVTLTPWVLRTLWYKKALRSSLLKFLLWFAIYIYILFFCFFVFVFFVSVIDTKQLHFIIDHVR